MDKNIEFFNWILLELVTSYRHIIFGARCVKDKQEGWKQIFAELLDARLVNANRDWKWIRRIWYNLTYLAKRSREQYLLGRIYDIPEFDKKLLMISGIPVESSKEQTSDAVNRLNMENQRDDTSFETSEETITEQINHAVNQLSMENQRELNCLESRDHVDITEHKFRAEDVESKELLGDMELNFLSRKVNEQRFKLQRGKLLKRKCEIYNMKNEYNEREKQMKFL